MRRLFAIPVMFGILLSQANAECICQCVNGQLQSVCQAPNDLPAQCGAQDCTKSSPLPAASIAQPRVAPQPTAPVAVPNELTTTAPPSITAPGPGPSSTSPNSRIESSADSGAGGLPAPPIPTPVPRSITRSPPSAAPAPSTQSLCFSRRVFNIETKEYEWQQVCE